MDLKKIRNYIFKNLSSGVFKTAINTIFTLVALPIVVKYIGIDNYGLISLVLLFANFSGLLDLGLSKSLIVFNKKVTGKSREEVQAVLFINICLSAFFIGFSVLTYIYELNFFGRIISGNVTEVNLINFFAILLLGVELINNLLRAILESTYRLHWVNWGFVLQSTSLNLGWLYLVLSNASLAQFIYVPIISAVITLVFHLILCPEYMADLKIPKWGVLKRVFGTTLGFFKIGALNSIHLPIIKYAVILFLGDNKAVGIFELSTRIAILVNNTLSYLTTPIFSISASQNNENSPEIWRITKKLTRVIAFLTIIGYGVFLLLHKWIIRLFYKEYSSEIFQVLNLILLAFCFVAVAESIQKFFLGMGQVGTVIRYKFLSVVLNVLLLFLLYASGYYTFVSIIASYSASLILFSCTWIFKLRNSGTLPFAICRLP